MRGLLRKELSGLWSLYRKTLPMIAVLYAVLNLVTKNDFFLYFGVWMMLFYSLSGMSLDESCGWGRYARTLPVSDWQVVGAKFLVSLVYSGGAVLYCAALGVAQRIITGEKGYADLIGGLLAVLVVSMVMVFLMYPMAFRFGLEKARNGFLVVWVAIFGGGMLFGSKLEQVLPLEAVLRNMAARPLLWAGGALVTALVVMALCYVSSVRIYSKKEF